VIAWAELHWSGPRTTRTAGPADGRGPGGPSKTQLLSPLRDEGDPVATNDPSDTMINRVKEESQK